MNRKIVTGAIIALAAGIAAVLYKRNRNKIDDAAADAYDKVSDGIEYSEEKIESIFS